MRRQVVVRDRAGIVAGHTQGDASRCAAVAAETGLGIATHRIFADGVDTRGERIDSAGRRSGGREILTIPPDVQCKGPGACRAAVGRDNILVDGQRGVFLLVRVGAVDVLALVGDDRRRAAGEVHRLAGLRQTVQRRRTREAGQKKACRRLLSDCHLRARRSEQ